MVCTAGCSSVHICQQNTCYMVFASEGILIVEMTIPCNSLTIFCIRHSLCTCYNLIVHLLQSNDGINGVIVTPCGLEQTILIVICQAIVGCIVNREQCLERQALDKLAHVVVDTRIELELTTNSLRLTTKVAVSNGISLRIVSTTTGEPLTANQVQRFTERSQCFARIGVNHANRNQWSCILWEVWSHR